MYSILIRPHTTPTLFPYTTLFRSKQLIRNGRSASLQRTFKKSFTSFSHSTRNKTRDGLIRVRNIRALNGRFNTSITHAYSIVIGSKHITLNATGGIQGDRSEERFSRNAETDLVCRLLLEKKKAIILLPYPAALTIWDGFGLGCFRFCWPLL